MKKVNLCFIFQDGDVEQYNPVEFLYDHTYIILRVSIF